LGGGSGGAGVGGAFGTGCAAGNTGVSGLGGAGTVGTGGTAGRVGTAGTGGTASGGSVGTGGAAGGAGHPGTGGMAGGAGPGGTGGTPTSCTVGTACPSGFCNTTTQKCVANQCQDGTKDGAETDVDCGGTTCPKCDVNKVCAINGDCKTGSCSRLFCALMSGPPNWLPGPALYYGRGFVAAGIAPGNGEETIFVTGGRDDSDDGRNNSADLRPNATVNPQAGAPGTSVAVTGSNFAANATVSIYLGSITGAPLATGTTNATGALTAPINFVVPSLAGGAQKLIVLDDRSQYPITLEFQVQ
jgi:hypothetical protein